jgi:hypothetical protein
MNNYLNHQPKNFSMKGFIHLTTIICMLLMMACASIRDADGNVYHKVKIGNQIWLTENMRSTRCFNDVSICNIEDSTMWVNIGTPAFCWYDNDRQTHENPYGALYNWPAVRDCKLCPKGYRVPWVEVQLPGAR